MIQKRDNKSGALFFHSTKGEIKAVKQDKKQKIKLTQLEEEVKDLKKLKGQLLSYLQVLPRHIQLN